MNPARHFFADATRARRIAFGVALVAVGVFALFLTRHGYSHPTFEGGSTYRGRGIEISFPRGWQHNDGKFKIGGKFRGEPIVAAWEGPGQYAYSNTPGVTVRLLPTKGATNSLEFATMDRKAMLHLSTEKTGAWQLEQVSAQYVTWHEHDGDYYDAYIISPKGKGWWLTFYSPSGTLAAQRLVFEKIAKTVRLD